MKSSVVSVRPMVSIMMPRMTVCVVPRTQSNVWGKKNVNTAMQMMNTEVLSASHLLKP